jgi:hypothetical protein
MYILWKIHTDILANKSTRNSVKNDATKKYKEINQRFIYHAATSFAVILVWIFANYKGSELLIKVGENGIAFSLLWYPGIINGSCWMH